MKTLGPRSVSSVLKIFLDIAYGLLAAGLIAVGALALLSALAMVNPEPFITWRMPRSGVPILAESPRGAGRLVLFALNTLGLMAIVSLLRQIFKTLIAGQPFVTENAVRLRLIGVVLAAIELARYGVWAIIASGLAEPSRFWRPSIDITGLFAIGVMFVLAEVFEEGVKLRRDADLTI